MLEQLVAARGVDKNAAISVAITEDYFRLFGAIDARRAFTSVDT